METIKQFLLRVILGNTFIVLQFNQKEKQIRYWTRTIARGYLPQMLRQCADNFESDFAMQTRPKVAEDPGNDGGGGIPGGASGASGDQAGSKATKEKES